MRRSVALVASAVLALLLASGVVILSLVLFEGLDARPARAAAAVTTYTYTDLGTLTDVSTRPGMGNTIARGVNTSGQVVGHSQQLLEDGSLGLRAFYWDGSKMLDLGTLTPEGPTSAARGINDKGQVVGFSRVFATGTQQQAFVAKKDAEGAMHMSPLGTLPDFPSSEAFAINEKGQIVGRSSNNAAPPSNPPGPPISSGRAFLYQDGEMKDLEALPNDSLPEGEDPYSEAWAINDRGQVVGESGTDEDHGKAFLYSGDTMTGLGTLPGQPYSEAFGIDNSGQIVGWSYSSRAAVQGRAFIYRNGEMEDLGTLKDDTYSMARAIDEHGRVVGQSRAASGTTPNRAFLWENGEMTDLNSLVTSFSDPSLEPPLKKLLDAYAISESGQIVGSALNTKDKVRAFLLTPNDTTPPTTMATSSPDPNAGWNNSDVTVTLNATDTGGSNLKEIRYTTDGTAPTKTTGTVYTAPIAVSSTTTIKYPAVDNAGNAEAFNTFQVNIDKTKPTVGAVSADKLDSSGTPVGTYNAGDWTNKDVKVSWTCTDADSGAVNASGSQTITTEGASNSVTPSCEDNAGNTASGTAFSPIKIDKSAPSVSGCSVTPSKLNTSANNHRLVTVTAPMLTDSGGSGPNGLTLFSVTSSQPDSGLGPDDVPNDIQGWTTGTNLTNGQLSSGQLRAERYGGARVYTLTYQGKDLAGNTAECKPTVTVPKGG